MAAAPVQAAEAKTVVAYNSYLQPPFLTDTGGLAAELVAYLNRKLNGAYKLQLENLSRSYLLRGYLERAENFSGVALFFNPRFVDDVAKRRYLWTPPLLQDSNVLVFHGTAAPQIKELGALKGMSFAATRGHRYLGLDQMVEQKLIVRHDAANDFTNLKQVASGRMDFAQTNASSFRQMSTDMAIAGRVVAIPIPGEGPFLRHILVGKRQEELADLLNAIITAMPRDPQWTAIVERFGLSAAQP